MLSDPVSSTDNSEKQKFRKISTSEIAGVIRSYSPVRHIILSGGEPTLQNLSLIFAELGNDYSFEVETNGTQIPHKLHKTFHPDFYNLAQWNISPKGRNAGQQIDAEALQHWSLLAQNHPRVFFKFVIRQEHRDSDAAEAEELIQSFGFDPARVIVMAEGTNVDSQTNNSWLEDICLSKGWTLSPRLHVLNHGNKRGV
jgi:organic radical activating enzyme